MAESKKQRFIIRKLVFENFKSYAGVQEVGPFHKVCTLRPARLPTGAVDLGGRLARERCRPAPAAVPTAPSLIFAC